MSQEMIQRQALVQLMESISVAVTRTARMEFLSMKQLLTSSEVEELYGINARTLAFKRSRGEVRTTFRRTSTVQFFTGIPTSRHISIGIAVGALEVCSQKGNGSLPAVRAQVSVSLGHGNGSMPHQLRDHQ